MSIESVKSSNATIIPTNSNLSPESLLGNGNGNGPPRSELTSVSTTVKISEEAQALLSAETLGSGNGNDPPAAPDPTTAPLGSGNGNDPPQGV